MQEQKEMFQSWGIVGDWENAYHTMDPKYEAKQLEVFGELFKKGFHSKTKRNNLSNIEKTKIVIFIEV